MLNLESHFNESKCGFGWFQPVFSLAGLLRLKDLSKTT